MIVSLGKCSIPVWVSISDGHWQISIHFQKIREIVVCTNEKKSDFHIGHDEEIIYICCDLTSFFLFFLQNFVAGTSKNLSNDSKEQKIAWLTPTGIQFPNGPWVSGMETGPICKSYICTRLQFIMKIWCQPCTVRPHCTLSLCPRKT
jgi:hypothetical protein